jgi:PAS domain S-box-containing protein
VKIYPRILINILPLIMLGLLFVGGLTYYLSQNAMTNLAEKWLTTKLSDATRIASEDLAVLQKYGLQHIEANVVKAQIHAGEAIERIPLGGHGYVWAVNNQGVIVVHPDADRTGARVDGEKWFQQINGRLGGKVYYPGRNEKMLTVYKYFAPWGWYVLASAPLSELYGEADKMRTYMIAIGLAALVVTAVVLMVLARRLTAPLNTLAREAERIGGGDHRTVPLLEGGDEIGTLSAAFNRMSVQIGRRIAQEQIISDISRHFIQISSSNIDASILEALRKIGLYTGADRCYVGEFSLDERLVGQTHEWCRQGVRPQIDNMVGLALDDLPWFMDQLENAGYLLVPDLESMPPQAGAEKKLWARRGLRSVARVPMVYAGQLRGFVGLDAIERQQDWSQEEIFFLQRVAEIFCYSLERQWFQESLAAEKERLAVTLQSIGDGVITTDVDGRIVLINAVGQSLTGWPHDEAVGRPMGDVFCILDGTTRTPLVNPLADILETGANISAASACLLKSRKGVERLIASSVAPIYDSDAKIVGAVLVFRDITEKRRMQEELLKVEKLESIGVLAGGIAHDFNNILTAIIGNVALTKRYAEPGSKIFAKMGEIEKAAFRAKDLTQQLLTFSKGGEPVKKPLDLGRIFRDSALFALGGTNVALNHSPPVDLWPVEADESQICQVINNLVINAVQAMPNGGVIQAVLQNMTLSQASPLPLPPGRYVQLSIKDFGCGIPARNLSRIFDPFYTTKKTGNGLGLATAYSIMEKHGGYITVDSRLGGWTLFTLFLPASDKTVLDLPEAGPPLACGTAKILVMDDEQIILDLVADILGHAGYQVAVAREGMEMIDIYRKSRDTGSPFDAVILDLTIPGGMGGKDAIRYLLDLDPQARAIVSSGYSTDPVMADFARFGFCGAVSKPYRIEELCNAVRQALNGDC